MKKEKIGCIICAYNEEKRIGNVLKVALGSKLIDEVLVVDDGSSDNTSKIARDLGARVERLSTNQGKGAALQKGFDSLNADAYILLDADLLNLKEEHLEALLNGLKDGAHMVIGQMTKGRLLVDLAQKFFSMLNGIRLITKEALDYVEDLSPFRYGAEIALNHYIEKSGLMILRVYLVGLSQYVKEEKEGGKLKGFEHRLIMFKEIIQAYSKLKKPRL